MKDPSSANIHTISIVWLFNGQNVGSAVSIIEPYSAASATQHGKPFAEFSLVFHSSGVGFAKVYWDAQNPAAPNDDRALAQTVSFTVR